MKKAIAIIPARWWSTRFPGKPLYPIAGKALLQHVISNVRKAKSLRNVIVATDDMRIAEAAFAWDAEVSLTSKRHRSGTDRIAEVAAKIPDAAYIINVQGDEPLVDPKLIDRMVETMRRDPKIEMITAAHPFENPGDAASPHQVKVVRDLAGRALYFSRAAIPCSGGGGLPAFAGSGRSGARPAVFLRHQGIYGYTRDLLLRFVRWKPSPLERAESLEQLRALENGVKISVLLTSHGSPGVDTPADAEAIARLLSARSSTRHLKRRP